MNAYIRYEVGFWRIFLIKRLNLFSPGASSAGISLMSEPEKDEA